MRENLDGLLEKYASLKDFRWAKEKIRELCRQESREQAAKILDNIILNLREVDDGKLIRWGNTLNPSTSPHHEAGQKQGHCGNEQQATTSGPFSRILANIFLLSPFSASYC